MEGDSGASIGSLQDSNHYIEVHQFPIPHLAGQHACFHLSLLLPKRGGLRKDSRVKEKFQSTSWHAVDIHVQYFRYFKLTTCISHHVDWYAFTQIGQHPHLLSKYSTCLNVFSFSSVSLPYLLSQSTAYTPILMRS